MEVSKIRLSTSEKELVSSADIILTKNSIIKKAVSVLEWVQEETVKDSSQYHTSLFSIPGKISKGENYKGLPYAILDFPRVSEKEDFCFIRTMFWWGNFFSSTLHVAGKPKIDLETGGKEIYPMLKNSDYFIGIGQDPWVHHFETDNYKRIREIDETTFLQIMNNSPFIKIATKFPLDEWETVAMALINSWNNLAGLVTKTVK